MFPIISGLFRSRNDQVVCRACFRVRKAAQQRSEVALCIGRDTSKVEKYLSVYRQSEFIARVFFVLNGSRLEQRFIDTAWNQIDSRGQNWLLARRKVIQ